MCLETLVIGHPSFGMTTFLPKLESALKVISYEISYEIAYEVTYEIWLCMSWPQECHFQSFVLPAVGYLNLNWPFLHRKGHPHWEIYYPWFLLHYDLFSMPWFTCRHNSTHYSIAMILNHQKKSSLNCYLVNAPREYWVSHLACSVHDNLDIHCIEGACTKTKCEIALRYIRVFNVPVPSSLHQAKFSYVQFFYT